MGYFKKRGEFLAPKTLRDRFSGVNAMKIFSMKHPLDWRNLFKAATKLRSELPRDMEMESIPLTKLSSLAEDIHIKKRKASQNTNLDMPDVLGIDKALQGIQGELLNNTSKLTEINKSIKIDTKSW